MPVAASMTTVVCDRVVCMDMAHLTKLNLKTIENLISKGIIHNRRKKDLSSCLEIHSVKLSFLVTQLPISKDTGAGET